MSERESQNSVNRPATGSHGLHTAVLPDTGARACERLARYLGLPTAHRLGAASLLPVTALAVEGPGSLVLTSEGGVRTTTPIELAPAGALAVPGSLLADEGPDGLLHSAALPEAHAVVLECTWADGEFVTDEVIDLVLRRTLVLNLIAAEVRLLQGRAVLEDQAAALVSVHQGHGYLFGPRGPTFHA
jgi:hypothetical protein